MMLELCRMAEVAADVKMEESSAAAVETPEAVLSASLFAANHSQITDQAHVRTPSAVLRALTTGCTVRGSHAVAGEKLVPCCRVGLLRAHIRIATEPSNPLVCRILSWPSWRNFKTNLPK
jgi:hypothetical protein